MENIDKSIWGLFGKFGNNWRRFEKDRKFLQVVMADLLEPEGLGGCPFIVKNVCKIIP